MKFSPYHTSLAAVLCVSLFFSCTSDIDLPPPPVNTSSGSVVVSSSSSVVQGSSSSVLSSGSVAGSSSAVVSSSSSVVQGSSSSVLSSSSVASSSSAVASSSSVVSSSSSVVSSSSSDLCTGFVNGTKRTHYGKEKEQFCDSRDGKKYVYVTIGTQTWMAENLNYNATGSKCYDNDETNCNTYGRLYNWSTAMTACPSGWHLPSAADWNVLMKFVNLSCSDNSTCAGAGTKLKATSGWNSYSGVPSGTDNYGFSALPGGYGNSNGNFYYAGTYGYWWSASESNASRAYYRIMYYSSEDAGWDDGDKYRLRSVRCLQD